MSMHDLHIVLADDDTDDCVFFEEAISGWLPAENFTAVHDGEQLMHLLCNNAPTLPDLIFLDLNMPRKNGFECLTEIKQNNQLHLLPVVIFSTSYEQEVVTGLYDNGAKYFIRKPSEFILFKKIILYTLTLLLQEPLLQPQREHFVLTVENSQHIPINT